VAGGAFNVSRLIRELGLQVLGADDLMRVRTEIQPVMAVGDLSDVTPPHVAPTALFGRTLLSGGGNTWKFEVQCLAPGGGFCEWIMYNGVANALMRVGLTTITAGGVVVPNVGQLSRDPIVSIVRAADSVPAGLPGAILSGAGEFYPMAPRPMFIPRGSFLQFEAGALATVGNLSFVWREVPASEFDPN